MTGETTSSSSSGRRDAESEGAAITDGQKIVSYRRDRQGDFRLEAGFIGREVDVVNRQAWREIDKKIAHSRELVARGQVSPLHYFMTVNLMDPALLAQASCLPRWKIHLHLRPFVFKRLSKPILKRYANLFQISIDELRCGCAAEPSGAK